MDHQLQTFIAVAEIKNFTRAAESLHITQAAVTLAIKSLEKKYQVKLIDRTNKYVRLTNAGEILYFHGKKILDHYQRVDRLIDDLANNARGDLLIGSSFTFGEYILPRLLGKFQQLYPEINPEISISNSSRVLRDVSDGKLDVGIIEGNITDNHLLLQSFAKDEMLVILPSNHPLREKNEVDLSELADETWIIREQGSGTRLAAEQLFEAHHFTPASIRSFGSSQVIKESVEASLGISFLSEWVVQKEVRLGTIKTTRVKHTPVVRNFSYVLNQTEFRPKTTQLFIDFLSTVPYSRLK